MTTWWSRTGKQNGFTNRNNAMEIKFTPEQIQILIDSMRDRIGKLYEFSEVYRVDGNKEAQMDCLEEKRRVQELLNIFTAF